MVLDYADDALGVTVTDDGIPGTLESAEPGGGHGLIGIQERVAVVGGEVDRRAQARTAASRSGPGSRTRVEVS